ncbi:MAG TPA: thiamine biosynthesis protein ThiS [Dehalococcoidia bacterium]|jgi:sulfur carrier protein|nr:thiamine biosynthesis protein ThiS [Dehalococcoidia bacterium]|tara:strand:- start:1467 stop:1670 length:204 start_codon:yes stop_codon:yes gene_type:complete
MIRLVVNGKDIEMNEGTSVNDLIESYNLDTKFIAVGYNGDVIKKEDYQSTLLQDSDFVELVKPVGGG